MAAALDGATDAELDARPAPGKWSARRDRPPSGRQRDDVGDPSASARRRRATRPSAPYDRESCSRDVSTTIGRSPARSWRFRPREARRRDLLDRMTEADFAKDRHASRTRQLQRGPLARDLRRARAQSRRSDQARAHGACRDMNPSFTSLDFDHRVALARHVGVLRSRSARRVVAGDSIGHGAARARAPMRWNGSRPSSRTRCSDALAGRFTAR